MEVAIIIVVIIFVFFITISIWTYISIMWLSKSILEPTLNVELPDEAVSWAKENSFEFCGSYKTKVGFVTAFISVWRRSDNSTHLCYCFLKSFMMSKEIYEFGTEFNEGISVETCSDKDTHFLPTPSLAYIQSFSKIGFNERWNKHNEANNFLIDTIKAKLSENDDGFERKFTEAKQKQINYIRSLPLWPLRGSWWYFVRRYQWHNKSIAKQYEKGMIKLTSEYS